MNDPLVTPWGRYDRAAVIARAREIRAERGPMEWGEALTLAYAEASAALRAPTPAIAIHKDTAA